MVNQYQGKDVKVFGDANILDYYSLNSRSLWANVGYEACFFVGFLLIAWSALTLIRHQKR